MTVVKVLVLPHGAGLDMPSYETEQAAGMDLRAAVTEPLELAPRQRKLVPTGLKIELPRDFEGQVRPRSGLAIKHGITLINSPGTIDADYRGELMVPLVNHGDQNFTIERGMRIAQMVVAPVNQVALEVVAELSDSSRGQGGFGSTGS